MIKVIIFNSIIIQSPKNELELSPRIMDKKFIKMNIILFKVTDICQVGYI